MRWSSLCHIPLHCSLTPHTSEIRDLAGCQGWVQVTVCVNIDGLDSARSHRTRPQGLHCGGVHVVELHVSLSKMHFSWECLARALTVAEPQPRLWCEGGSWLGCARLAAQGVRGIWCHMARFQLSQWPQILLRPSELERVWPLS